MKLGRLAAGACLLALLPAPALAREGLDWDQAFPTAAAPAQVHFLARYTDALGAPHRLEVWRDGDRRLRRRTDDRLDLHVEKGADGEHRYQLVDHARAVVVSVDRTTLYRIGSFSDWVGLAHVLSPLAGGRVRTEHAAVIAQLGQFFESADQPFTLEFAGSQ